MNSTLGPFTLGIVLFLVLLAILWFILPFAIFGTKPKLDLLLLEMRQTNALLKRLLDQKPPATANTAPAPKSPTSTDSQDRLMTPRDKMLTQDELIMKYSIIKLGDKYKFGDFRYDNLEDALAYARKQRSKGHA